MRDHRQDIHNFIKVWLTVLISLSYVYFIKNKLFKPIKTLIFLLPIVFLFLYLPLTLTSPNLSGFTAFFISWLANFKILLLAFGHGPLSSKSNPKISLPLFIALCSLPIKIQQTPTQNSKSVSNASEGFLSYAIKAMVLATIVRVCDYSEYIHPQVILILYAFHIYFLLEIILAISAYMARTALGLELERQFNEPYLSTSLQDFWGKRWNLMVTSILRPTVYEPIRCISTRLIGRRWAPLPAVLGTFVVSGLMHELMFYYLGRVNPTWDIMCFFLIHGVCLTVEIGVKKALYNRWRLPGVVSGFMTLCFLFVTVPRLFSTKFIELEIDVKAFEDYAALSAFVKSVFNKVSHV